MNTSGENLIQKDIEQEMKDAYLDYSMSVIASRALPDVRDGLKPVHRRILYTMYGNGLYPEREFRKCADTVGNVLGQYHPHGDASVYDALVRLAQDFPCVTRWYTVTATSVRSTATRRQLTDTPSRR